MTNSDQETSSDNEGDKTMVESNAAVAEFQEQIRILQLSLEASEKERLLLKQTLASTTSAVETKTSESLPDSGHNATPAPATPMYATTSSTAEYNFQSMEHRNVSSAAALATPISNTATPIYITTPTTANYPIYSTPHISSNAAALAVHAPDAAAADVFSTRSYAFTNCANTTTADHHALRYVQPITSQRHFNLPTGNYLSNANFANINSTAAVSANNTPSYSIFNPQPTFTPSHNQPSTRKLQDLPQFSGSPEDWPMFIVAYNETTNMYAYTNVENLLRLQKALKGDARSKVESLLIHPSSVNAVISSLQFHFGRPELLIRSQLAKARTFPPITSGKIHEIANFCSMVTNLVAFLQNAGAVPHLSNPTLLDELVSKLPLYKREEWARHICSMNKQFPTICEFSSWLQQLSTYIVMAAELNPPHVSADKPPRNYNINKTKQVLAVSEEKFKCVFCKDNHRLYQCSKFKDCKYDEKWEIVKTNRLCFCCLSTGHNVHNCPRRRPCGVSLCQKYHNKLLHNEIAKNNNTGSTTPAGSAVATVNTFRLPGNNKKQLTNESNKANTIANVNKTLLKFLPVNLHGPKGSMQIIAFIDEGAKVTLLEEEIANKLGLTGKKDLLHLKWFDEQTTSEVSTRVNLEVSNVNNNYTFDMKGVRTIKKLLLPPQTLCIEKFAHQFKELNNIPIVNYTDATPKILIGMPHTNLVRPLSVVNFTEGFTVHETKLGWTLFGSDENNFNNYTICHVDVSDHMNEIQKQLDDYFALEAFEPKLPVIKSAADIRAEIILESTTQLVGGRYVTGLLWRNDNITMPDSYDVALRRLQLVEQKMLRNSSYAKWYNEKIYEYIKKGYAKKLSIDETELQTDGVWYLPHFAVYNVNKGNKPRLVFDAAAKINGISLNTMLLKGPDDYQPRSLQSILFKFREGVVAVCGDIREMFHRIDIIEKDQNFQRFLWREGDTSRPPDVYVMKAMIFGSICSPCSAQFVKNLNALKFKDENQRAFEAIVNRHYVDDYVDSFASVDESISVTKKVIEIHCKAGFELRGFMSNSSKLLSDIGCTATSQGESKNMCSSESAQEKVLGMHWNSKCDAFFFNLTFARIPKSVLDGTRRPTKAELLGLTMSIFDPYGFLANVTLLPKILLQRLWKLNIDWHDAIPVDIYDKWYQWYTMLGYLSALRIPRCYGENFLDPSSEVQLHIFADASELAFAAVAYFRIALQGEINVSFVAAKSRCSPLKSMSIPRLELQAAVLGTRLCKFITDSHTVRPQSITFWSDSKTVIQWIRSEARQYKQFVSHRISEILHSSEVAQWRWIPGTLNPADEATRPQSNTNFANGSSWISGPTFLMQDEVDWPQMSDVIRMDCGDEEKRAKPLYTVELNENIIPFTKYSNYHKFLKVMTWVRFAVSKFLALVRRDAEVTKEPLKITAHEIKETEIKLCRIVQETSFSEDIATLRKGSQLSKHSSIFKLTPLLDDKGLLRVGGRIDNALCLPVDTRRPIILPKSHAMSRLLVRHYHEIFYHQNQEAIICAIRSKFWIPSLRCVARSVKRECQVCKNSAAKPQPPLMGQIPSDRLQPYIRPFSYTGIDYFGPVMISVGRRREKRWVALFTCLTIRAIHLEVARDLSTDAVILCLRNFVNRRGVPVRIRSDRGTNFVGASKVDWLHTAAGIEKECVRRGIEWVFNTPGNPSAGGVWERMVRSVKGVLAFTLKETAPQIETLQSLLIEAENIVNSRPLTHLPIESIDANPLTPNHFLLGCPNYVQTPVDTAAVCLGKQWRILQHLKQTFWRRWILEYLPTLTRRTKWHQSIKPIQIGDVVVVCDGNECIGDWRRGIVLEVFPAPDGQVRSALIKTSSGNLKRPASKLAVLDVSSEPQIAAAPSLHGGRDVIDICT